MYHLQLKFLDYPWISIAVGVKKPITELQESLEEFAAEHVNYRVVSDQEAWETCQKELVTM